MVCCLSWKLRNAKIRLNLGLLSLLIAQLRETVVSAQTVLPRRQTSDNWVFDSLWESSFLFLLLCDNTWGRRGEGLQLSAHFCAQHEHQYECTHHLVWGGLESNIFLASGDGTQFESELDSLQEGGVFKSNIFPASGDGAQFDESRLDSLRGRGGGLIESTFFPRVIMPQANRIQCFHTHSKVCVCVCFVICTFPYLSCVPFKAVRPACNWLHFLESRISSGNAGQWCDVRMPLVWAGVMLWGWTGDAPSQQNIPLLWW